MDQNHSAKARRAKKNVIAIFSDDDSMDDIDTLDDSLNKSSAKNKSVNEVMKEDMSAEELARVSESLKEMSNEEMAEHLKICMKLSAENKINIKNAFGLHLIQIMQKMVKNEKTDLQQASLSLQASSKIYAGRVEALYQDTMRFHSHLQSIAFGNKKDKKKHPGDEFGGDDDDDDNSSEKGKTKPQKSKCKSFLKSEESLTMEQDISLSTGEPHANFVTVNAAFNTSRLAPKLLSSLQLSDDFCKIRCATSELCFKPKIALTDGNYSCPTKLKGILEKIKNLNLSKSTFESLSDSTDVPAPPYMSTPKTPARSLGSESFNDNDFAVPNDVPMAQDCLEEEPNLIEAAINKLDVLNITADVFINDIAAAVTNDGVDHTLLPPNSVLKKMLDRSRRTGVKPSAGGKTTKKKIKEPFFTGKSASDIKHLFVKGRSTTLSQKILSEWNVDKTSNFDLAYGFLEELEMRKEEETDYHAMPLDAVLDVIKQNDPQYQLKYYFNKQSQQMMKFCRRNLCLSRSFVGSANQTEKRVGSLAPTDPEALALSLQNLSLHDSIHEISDNGENMCENESPIENYGNEARAGDYNDDAPVEAPDFIEEPQFVLPQFESFDTDIDEIMVKPPELVKPAVMKFAQRPLNLNTEKIKNLLWSIILKHMQNNSNTVESQQPFVLFSEVYEELKRKLEKEISEFVSMQFAFVVLLILSNEKTLLIENVEESSDLSIKQDISETETLENL